MNINQIGHVDSVVSKLDRSAAARRPGNALDTADFSGAEALEKALRQELEVRPDKLEKAKTATSSLIYPPEELIQGISRLIAEGLWGSDQSDEQS